MALIGMQLGHYTLTKLVGSGGMGEVYLAEDARMHRQVAIKILRSEASAFADSNSTREATRLFQREMSIILSLDHPRILPLYDYGEEDMQKVTLTYMVMPYRPEGSLDDWLQKRGTREPLSPQDTAFFVQQAGEALQYAHDHNVIHQDVKPSNFLTWTAGEPAHPNLLLADFGIAKVLSATSSASQSVRGTPAYMPPEQWDGHPVPASDQYALAIMTYLLLTAQLPFTGRPEQVMRGHFFTPPPPPSSVNPRLSSAVDMVILRALEKSPANRYPSITEFVKAFQQALLYEPTRFVSNPSMPILPIAPPPPQFPPPPQATGDLQATLTLSSVEAMNGITRSLNLPGGRSIAVQIPPRAYSGQVIRLSGMGQPHYPGGPNGDVIITLAVSPMAATERVDNLHVNDNRWNSSPDIRDSHNGQQEQQQLVILSDTSSNPNIGSTRLATPDPFPLPGPLPGPTPTPNPTPTPRPKRRIYIISLVVVALLVVLASIGVFTVNTITTNNAHATATAVSNTAIANTDATHTAQANATAVAQAHQQATASAQATATAIFIQQNPDTYTGNGTIDFADPLNSTTASQFVATSDSTFGGSCAFTTGNFDISQTITNRFYTCYSTPQFNNFVFEVHMVIIKGDCGGVTFRDNTSNSQLYALFVCADRYFKLTRYADTTATNAKDLIPATLSSDITQGYGVENVIAVVANGSTLTVFANHHQLGSVQDSNYNSGSLGLFANSTTSATEVQYYNARVWTL